MRRTPNRLGVPLRDRLAALADALELGTGRLDDEALAGARAVLARAGKRLALAPGRTVVALAGATGSGKSSLFNALAGLRLAEVSVRRPTTDLARAAVWPALETPDGPAEEASLLDWLGVVHRNRVEGADGALDGLVLLDLPDLDSVETNHRVEVDRLVAVVDLLVWVLDPQKYADAALHQRYLRPLAGHGDVMVFALNHADLLEPAALELCRRDLRRLLSSYGVAGAPVLATSAATGSGIEELRSLIAERVASRRAATDRLTADVVAVASELAQACDGGRGVRAPGRAEQQRVADALAAAAGVEAVAKAARAAHYREARLVTGWPFTRWLRRLRSDPLQTLLAARRRASGVSPGSLRETARARPPSGEPSIAAANTPRTGRPVSPSASERAEVAIALRNAAAAAAADLPHPWSATIRRAATRGEDAALAGIDEALFRIDVEIRGPRWWGAASALQWLLTTVTILGLAWLGVLFVLSFFQIPQIRTPRLRGWPAPTILAVGGAVAGLLLAGLAGRVAALQARARGRRVDRRLRRRLAVLADERALAPLRQELEAQTRFCQALVAARR